jgi:hypothetical protein
MKAFTIIIGLTILLISCNTTPQKSNNLSINTVKPKAVEVINILGSDTLFTFEKDKIGEIPANWSQYFTGKGKTTDWKIVDDNGNKVLAQVSFKHPNYHFNDIVFDGIQAKNITLQVKMKGVNGRMDHGGGFIWRFIDKDNYYVVRANPLEDNVVLYKVKNGKRTDLPVLGKGRTYGVAVDKLGSGWNILKLNVVDDLFAVYLNDKEIFQVKDDTFTTSGKIGLWTKADAVSYFDDFKIELLN